MSMELDEFIKRLSEKITEMLPEDLKGSSVRCEEKIKNNGVRLHGIAVVPQGNSAVPLVYVDSSYRQYLEGRTLDSIAEEVLKVSEEYRQQASSIKLPDLDFESIKDMLRARVINDRSNPQMLDRMVSRSVDCGFSLTAYIDLSLGPGPDGIIQVTRDIARANGYDPALVMDTALENSARLDPPYLCEVSDFLLEDDRTDVLDDGKDHSASPLLVLNHESSLFGAVSLFYPGIRERISRAAGGDYYVLPSSVHEVLIVPDTGEHDAMSLMVMVSYVNGSMLSDEDRLADRVLHYRSDMGRLTIAADLETAKEKEAERA